MLARMWNALSDRSAINSQTRNIYVGALTKPTIARPRITTPSFSLSSVLDFKKFNANTHGCSKLSQIVPRTACVRPGIEQNRVQGSTITGIVSLHGTLFKPTLGVIKWYANGRLPFTTSRSAGNEAKESGRKKLNSRNKKHSGVNTSKKCQTEQQQTQESSKTTKASVKQFPANGHVDAAETSKPMKTQSMTKSKIAKGKHSSPKNNKKPSSTLLKREINVQEPLNNSTEPFTTSVSATIKVKKSGGTKLNSRKKKNSKVNISKKYQTEQQQIQENSKITKESSRHSPANGHVDVAERSKLIKTQSSSKANIAKKKPSLLGNNKRPSSTLLKREANVQEPPNSSTKLTTASDKPQVKKIGSSKVNKSKSTYKNSVKAEKIDKNTSAKDAGQKSQVAVIKAKTSSLPKVQGHVDVAETSKLMKTQSSSKSKIAKGKSSLPKNNKGPSGTLLKRETNVQDPLNSSIRLTPVSDKPQAKKIGQSQVNKSRSTNKNSIKTEKIDKKTSAKDADQKSQVAVIEAKTRGLPKVQGHMDVAETSKLMKTQSSSKSIVKGKPSLPKNNKRPSSTSLKRETNVPDTLKSSTELTTASDKPQAKQVGWSKVNKSKSTNKNTVKTEKIDKKTSAKDAEMKSQVAVIKAKSSGLPKVNNDEQATKRNIKANKTDKKISTNVKSQAAAGEKSKKGNIKVSANRGAHLQVSRKIKLANAKKRELPDNVKLVSGKLSENKKANTPVHPDGKVLVVVESATKAKTIQKYLGDMYVVLASYGHVRDLAGRSGSVRPDEGFDMVWEVPTEAWTHIRAIEDASTRASSVVLASDPDREGEAIAWHVTEMLKMQPSWNENMLVKRVVFHEITKSAILNAMETPREISMNLVNAYLARRALDYLIGFNISPILWRKLPGCQSAGRVQSAALSLICEREKEIEDFVSQEYWTIEAEACTPDWPVPGTNSTARAKVTRIDGEKLEKFTINSETEAMKVVEKVSSSKFKVLNLKKSTMQKNAPQPYMTSTLQQDASNKLNFRASHTMKVAQKLYEGVKISDNEVVGLITYMRTDALRISEDALKSIQLQVIECYGEAYAVQGFRKFDKKVKNAQEAHEAIRPTDIRRIPSALANILEKDALKLYTLIWCRTMACQMSEAKITQVSVTFGNEDESLLLRSSGSAISFPGYLAVFKDNEIVSVKDDDEPEKVEDGKYSFLSQLKVRDAIDMNKAEGLKHVTEPLPRYSEGTLVKRLEELGIGRPSTYAPILKTLEAREYVTISSRRIYPEFRGRMVSAFLSHYFPEIIEYGFTADLESQLDNISAGRTAWKNVLNKFWESFHHDCGRLVNVDVHQVEKMLEQTFEDHLFSALPGKSRACPACNNGTLSFKVSRHGAGYFIGCDSYPKCSYIARTMFNEEDKEEELIAIDTKKFPAPKLLGEDPNSKQQVVLKGGPFGHYLQLGENKQGFTPKRVNVSQIKDISAITLEDALDMLKYPIILGKHPEDKEPVELKRTKTGFSIKHRNLISVIPKDVDHHTITLAMAVKLLKSKSTKRTGRPSQGKSRRRKPKILKSSL